MGNTNLAAAKAAKNDEFYTQLCDIEREMSAYWDHDKDVFKNKTILLPCDDPERSNFTRFFVHNLERFGIKKLISTSYAGAGGDSERRGRKLVLERSSNQVDVDDLPWEYLEGDGDFRSEEVTALRDEADMVITNPPFSLYREFVAWLVEGDVQFSIIGNKNSITYKVVFPLVKDNKMWVGHQSMSKAMLFGLPKKDQEAMLASGKPGSKYHIVDGEVLGHVPACWFTNIPHGRRYEKLQLMTMAENLMYSRRKKIREQGYPAYDNYDAIEVAFTEAIPSDWGGIAGVPVSFLDKYNPEQFEIVGTTNSNEEGNPYRTRWHSADEKRQAYEDRFGREGSYDLNAAGVVNGEKVYGRVLIRHIGDNHDGVMGVPISFLDKYNPEQFEILGCSKKHGRPTGWPEDVKMTPSVNGENIYERIFIRHRKA